MMTMKCQFHWWRKPEHPEETTDLRRVTKRDILKASEVTYQVTEASMPSNPVDVALLQCYQMLPFLRCAGRGIRRELMYLSPPGSSDRIC